MGGSGNAVVRAWKAARDQKMTQEGGSAVGREGRRPSVL